MEGTKDVQHEVTRGLLYQVWRDQETREELQQLVIPGEFPRQIWQLVHDTALGGHLEQNKTKVRITQDFFWPHLQEDVD